MSSRGEGLAIGALLAPWVILSLLLPLPHLIAALAMLCALAGLLMCAARWARMRADALALDGEAWALASVLTLGFGLLLLLGANGRSGFERFCDGCGRMSDARSSFCYGCGSYG